MYNVLFTVDCALWKDIRERKSRNVQFTVMKVIDCNVCFYEFRRRACEFLCCKNGNSIVVKINLRLLLLFRAKPKIFLVGGHWDYFFLSWSLQNYNNSNNNNINNDNNDKNTYHIVP